MRGLNDSNTSLKAVQKLLISSVGERDFSAQETCHLLLQLPLYRASHDFIYLSLDGSRVVQDHLDEHQPATAQSTLDHYIARPEVPPFQDMTLLYFAEYYLMPRHSDSQPSQRGKKVIVIVRPYCSPDPNGPKYEQYCKQKLMLYKPFRVIEELQGDCNTYAAAYVIFLQSGNVPPSLQDDIQRLEQQNQHSEEDYNPQEENQPDQSPPNRSVDEWMLVCQGNADLQPCNTNSEQNVDWTHAAQVYPNLDEMPSFIARQRQSSAQCVFTTTADPLQLTGKQLQAYTILQQHLQAEANTPLRLIVSGTAGTESPT